MYHIKGTDCIFREIAAVFRKLEIGGIFDKLNKVIKISHPHAPWLAIHTCHILLWHITRAVDRALGILALDVSRLGDYNVVQLLVVQRLLDRVAELYRLGDLRAGQVGHDELLAARVVGLDLGLVVGGAREVAPRPVPRRLRGQGVGARGAAAL